MDDRRFDDLARAVANRTSRRQVVRGFAGAALAGAAGLPRLRRVSAGEGECSGAADLEPCGQAGICCFGFCFEGSECCNNAECGECGVCNGTACSAIVDRVPCGTDGICCSGVCVEGGDCCGAEDCGECATCGGNICSAVIDRQSCGANGICCDGTCLEGGECCTAGHCPTGLCATATCEAGVCVFTPVEDCCEGDAFCGDCETCVDNVCTPLPDLEECGNAGLCCGGTCVEGGECCVDADCEAGNSCSTMTCDEGSCLDTPIAGCCETDDDCAECQVCGDDNTCMPADDTTLCNGGICCDGDCVDAEKCGPVLCAGDDLTCEADDDCCEDFVCLDDGVCGKKPDDQPSPIPTPAPVASLPSTGVGDSGDAESALTDLTQVALFGAGVAAAAYLRRPARGATGK